MLITDLFLIQIRPFLKRFTYRPPTDDCSSPPSLYFTLSRYINKKIKFQNDNNNFAYGADFFRIIPLWSPPFLQIYYNICNSLRSTDSNDTVEDLFLSNFP